jgi:hypothetical protein
VILNSHSAALVEFRSYFSGNRSILRLSFRYI